MKDHYYAFVDNYLEFPNPVHFKVGVDYFENGLRKADGTTNKGAFGRAVRNITDEVQAIVAAGLSKIKNETVREEVESYVPLVYPEVAKQIPRAFDVAYSI